jgi:hypothetical protein
LLFWVGVGLAPVAALLLVAGQGTGLLRAAAVLAVLGVVFIGLAVVFKEDPADVRDEMTDVLRREVGLVREELEAVRRGVEVRMRRELESVRGELDAARRETVRTETVSVHAERVVANEISAGSVRYTREIGTELAGDGRRAESVNPEASVLEPVRAESLRVESARLDPVRVAMGRVEAPRVATGRAEAPRVATGRVEAPRVATGRARAEAPRVATGRADAPQSAADRGEGPRPEQAPAEIVLPEPVRAEALAGGGDKSGPHGLARESAASNGAPVPSSVAASLNGWSTPIWDTGLRAPDPIRSPWNPPNWDADRSWPPAANLPALPELPALPAAPQSPFPREQQRPQSQPASSPAWEMPVWNPGQWDEPVRQPAPADRAAPHLRGPDWSMLDRLGPDRGLSDGTGTWSFVAPRPGVDYELPSIDHLPEPEPLGRHARRPGRHSASAEERHDQDLASERQSRRSGQGQTSSR